MKEAIEGPVLFYIEYKNFFLNHRKIAKSYSKNQLYNENVKSTSESSHFDGCDVVNPLSGDEETDLNSPCGRRAATFSRESLSGLKKKSFTLEDGTSIPEMSFKMIYSLGGIR